MKAHVAWCGGLFLTAWKVGVLSVSALFSKWVGVYVGVYVCIRTHTHTHCTGGVLCCELRSRDETPGEPEESRSTKAQYTCRSFGCTKYICLYICWAAGFDSWLTAFFSFNMSFLLRKLEDVTTISAPQSITSVRIQDCTLRVPNKTTTSFLSEQ